ncbi:hypothetical protein [Polystyrenella longa]|uniref:hypothetical protein n=1 Tax=Polystyrenella longa TaxID=2528007 RepID=UPI0011A3D3EB|nr:hypothetical protein [Polystyrenella longa]
MNREIRCPACEMDLRVHLNKAYQIEVEEVKPVVTEIALPVARKKELNLNPLYWTITGILMALLGYFYIMRPQHEVDESLPEVVKTVEESSPDIPEVVSEEELVETETTNAESVVELEREPVLAPRPAWVPRNLPPALAERPAVPPIPIPEKWEALMRLEIAQYEIPGLDRVKVLDELEMLAGTTFVYHDDEARARLEIEPTMVSIKLEQTGFGEVLKQTLDPVGLIFHLTEEDIVIQTIETAEEKPTSRQ